MSWVSNFLLVLVMSMWNAITCQRMKDHGHGRACVCGHDGERAMFVMLFEVLVQFRTGPGDDWRNKVLLHAGACTMAACAQHDGVCFIPSGFAFGPVRNCTSAAAAPFIIFILLVQGEGFRREEGVDVSDLATTILYSPELSFRTTFIFDACMLSDDGCGMNSVFGQKAKEIELGTGNPLMRASTPLKKDLFTLHHDYRKKNQNCIKRQWCMKVHVSSLHAPIYRNFYLCVRNFFLSSKHFDVERPVISFESLCANGSVPVHRRRNSSAN